MHADAVDTAQHVMDAATILANARAIAPLLREEADENERRRQLTPRAVDALRSAGVFRMPMPRAWGGPEAHICTQVEILEELAAADASSAWCVQVGSTAGFFAPALDDAVGRELFADLDVVVAGVAAPTGRLHPAGDGYRLEGRWQFGSASIHADLIYAGAIVHDGGEPVMRDGRPDYRYALLPADAFEIVDTWHTTGLAGTGSHDFTATDALVPANHTFRLADLTGDRHRGPLYAWPGMLVANFTGVPLGVARAALEATEALLADKVLTPERRPAREDPRVRADLARAHALVGAARSYGFDLLDDLWSTLEAGDEPSLRQRAALGGMKVHTIRACLEAVRLLTDIVGSASIYRSTPLERYARDLTTMSQHGVAQARRLELVGALWLGVDHILEENPVTRERVL